MDAVTCVNSERRQKASYPSAHAALAALKRSPRWRMRKTWPSPYRCYSCHRWHLGHPRVEA